MPSLRHALESALDADPDDRAARMALADHLAETGDPRGEFVQVQLFLEDESLPPSRRRELTDRESELLIAHSREWLGDFGRYLDAVKSDCIWERGELTDLTMSDLSFEAAAALAGCPAARRLRSLRVEDPANYSPEWGDPDAAPEGFPADKETSALVPLADAPFAPHLRTLWVGWGVDFDRGRYNSTGICAYGLADVVAKMPRLESLEVYAKRVDLDALFRLPLPRLWSLVLYHSNDVQRLSILAANDAMPALEVLRVHPAYQDGPTALPRAEVVALLNSPHFPKLRSLHIHGSDFGDEGCAALVASGVLKRLRVLDLRFGCVTDAGLRALLASPDLRRLEMLDLSQNELTDEGVALLKSSGVREAHASEQYERGEEMYLYSGDIE